jgi:glucan endo-1,3-alpha-glucosidase
MNRITAMAAALALSLAALAAGEEPAASARPPAERLVFAHYMVCFSSPPEFYKREIQLAQSHGIDGFVLNCGEWLRPDGSKSRYVTNAEAIFAAAQELGTGFRLVMSPDFACDGISKDPLRQVTDMHRRFAAHPNLWRIAGRPVLSGYSGTPGQYAGAMAELARDGGAPVLIPRSSDAGRHAMAWSLETVVRHLAGAEHLDGLFNFTCDGTVNDLVRSNAAGRRGTLMLGKYFLAGVCPAYNSPNLRDFRGLAGYGAMWEGLIRDGADFVEIVTWNDYAEDSNLMPFTWEGPLGRVDRDEAALDATAYYARWFKDGVRPRIAQDKVYLAYRTRGRDQTRVWDEKAAAWVDVRACAWPYDQLHDDVVDQVNLLAFLSADAEIELSCGGAPQRSAAKAGIAVASVPLAAGVPAVRILRGGQEVLAVRGGRQVIAQETEANSLKGMHNAYRTWISGAVAGAAQVRLQASAGACTGGAAAAGPAVLILDRDGAALAFTLPKLEAGCYGVRVSYRNPGADELRLTLAIDGGHGAGVAMNEGRTPDALPLYLPPGGADAATVSVLRSIQADSRSLALRCAKWRRPAGQAAGWDDRGGVEILAVELVRVQPPAAGAAPAAWGELVDIPAGRFVRGGPGGAPDELPARELAVPAFAIGRHEVTNAEFERFRPDHRRWRDGYSWRDREPVIYVSWSDAARYCNWLSAQHRLAPAYDEKTWAIDPAADGFRLPSEAEWEYVASGRGENRRYPWGDEAPRPGLHGNFDLERALALPGILRSQCEEGTAVVGSYPAGASRDGVMDLAGNVAEWCSDTYALTTPEGLLHTGEAHHRAIRGGSWGYYNGSQRCRDREFNNAGYGGYIYIGFRVAIPAAGAAKLAGR